MHPRQKHDQPRAHSALPLLESAHGDEELGPVRESMVDLVEAHARARERKVEPHSDALLDELLTGVVVDDRYRVDETLGRGAMGVVVAATHVHLHERVALKFLDTRIRVTVDDFYARFRREARVSAKLRGEHVARVRDVGLWQDRHPYMVMDLLTGVDLRKAMQTHGGLLPLALTTEYIVQLCEGMAEAHALGIVHRDLKPSNILITQRADGTELLKILDFGISKWTTDDVQLPGITLTGVVLGSPKYMAPEQLFGASTVDARADVWSIGAMLYELLTGRPPFDAPTLPQICRELALGRPPAGMQSESRPIAPALESVVMRCLAHEPSARIESVAELAGALLEAVGASQAHAVRARLSAALVSSTASSTASTLVSELLPGDIVSFVPRVSGEFARAVVSGSEDVAAAADNPLWPQPMLDQAQKATRGPTEDHGARKQRRALAVVGLAAALVSAAFAYVYFARPSANVYERSAAVQVTAHAKVQTKLDAPPTPTTTAMPAGQDAKRKGAKLAPAMRQAAGETPRQMATPALRRTAAPRARQLTTVAAPQSATPAARPSASAQHASESDPSSRLVRGRAEVQLQPPAAPANPLAERL